MSIEDLIVYGKRYLHTKEVHFLLSELLNKNPIELLDILHQEVDEKEVKHYQQMVSRLANNEPIQYVLGKVNFYGYWYQVNKNVLIPRFETEELIENTIKYVKKHFKSDENLQILDLCTGSGNIGITLKKELPKAKVVLTDISMEALDVARSNAKILNADVDLVYSDLFSNVKGNFDIIISNPPYIAKGETVDEKVLKYEPHLALYSENDGLYFYQEILKQAAKFLNSKYLLALEIGATQKEKVVAMIKEYFPKSRIFPHQDLQGRDRMIFVLSSDE